ncbi:hypothetical protein IFM89_028988 [Coptis chinensis]|uniref:Nascent polypeptide-associated complex subunit beta n=1 Tax=Coptis chinensis TaxID=261450 RepID=A0A835IGV9_9MAGN|nr:hypothetical protein IFM89_028988 [Coptis chinensis]
MNVEKLMKMAGAVRTGGKGSMGRKEKVVHRTTTTDDKRLQGTLKRLRVNVIPAIEEVNIFKDDTVIQFHNPKVQASIVANTWVVAKTVDLVKGQRGEDRRFGSFLFKDTIAMMGYGPEDKNVVLELTYNYGCHRVRQRKCLSLGDFLCFFYQIAIGTDDVYKIAAAIKLYGRKITGTGSLPGINTKIRLLGSRWLEIGMSTRPFASCLAV